jgi:hypothetical protein
MTTSVVKSWYFKDCFKTLPLLMVGNWVVSSEQIKHAKEENKLLRAD